MRDLETRVARYVVRIADALVVVGSLLLAIPLRRKLDGLVPGLKDLVSFEDFLLVGAAAVPIWWLTLGLTGGDRALENAPSAKTSFLGLLRAQLVSSAALLSLLYLSNLAVNRSVLALFQGLQLLGLLGLRVAFSLWVARRSRSGKGLSSTVIVAQDPESLGLEVSAGVRVEALKTDDPTTALKLLEELLHGRQVDRVILGAPFADLTASQSLRELCEERGVPSFLGLQPSDDLLAPEVVSLHGRPMLTYAPERRSGLFLALKQVVDFVGATLGLLLLSPLLVTVSALVFLADRGPVLFAQERVGRYGRRFRMLKFRTMVVDADARKKELLTENELDGPAFKMENDPRITPLGRFLRRSSIDELPQLFNVLAGDMAVVGPRPLPTDEQQRVYGAERRRLAMRPGITGLWQISGRSETGFEEWMNLDLEYVDNWSLWLDVKILLGTIPAVLFGRGAH